MKIIYALASLLVANAAFAAPLTVKEADVVNKVRETALKQVRLKSGPAVILTDAKGISVYTFDADTKNVSNCKGGCLNEWPTLKVPADETLPAPFGKIMGNDGKPQLTLNGLPLYYYADDKSPGDVFGDYPSWHPVTVVK
ncbi:MAG: COG4315 family predicted lipoprotein [Bdellovibrionota bacterium]